MIHKHLKAFFTAIDHRIHVAVAVLALVMVIVTASTPPPSHAFFVSGGNAVDLLGQFAADLSTPTPVFTKGYFNGVNDTPNLRGFHEIRGMDIDTVNHRFFVVDENHLRVLVYNLNPDNTFPDKLPDFVLGAPDFTTAQGNFTADRFGHPYDLSYDSVGNRLFVADRDYNRVLVFDTATITNGEAAINVLGQSTFSGTSSANTATGMNGPYSVLYDSANQRLFVAHATGNRVTVYNIGDGITNGEAAVNVLGQTDFSGSSEATTDTGMARPIDLAYDSTNQYLFVSEENNRRVTVWDVNAISDGEAAINVLGKPDFVTASGAGSASNLATARGISYDNTNDRLFVAQPGFSNGRVSIFNLSDGITNGEAAVNVLGKANFTATSTIPSQSNLHPSQVFYEGTTDRLYVADYSSRMMIFDVAAISNGENAIDVIGRSDGVDPTNPQPEYTRTGIGDGPNQYGMASPDGIVLDAVHHRLFVSDNGNNRVIVYNLNNDNTIQDYIIDYVLGKPDMYTSQSTSTTASTLSGPKGIDYDSANDRLFVTDSFNNRVLVYDTATISTGEAAVSVIGQTVMTASSSGNTQAGLNFPTAVLYDAVNQRLYVAQSSNNRVTTYNLSDGITDGENAVNVLGQTNFTNTAAALTDTGMGQPNGLALDTTNNRLYVSMGGQHRVLVYDVAAITDGEAAVNVLGQANFTSNTAASTQASTREPRGVHLDDVNKRLFVSQGNFANRITMFDVNTVTNNENAVGYLGTTSFTAALTGATSASRMYFPTGMYYNPASTRLYVSDGFNNRVTLFDAGPAPGLTVVQSGGTTAVTEGGATDSFTVALTSQPATDVVLNISSNDTTSATVDQATLTFTNGNWSTPQTVTVTAPEDADVVSETPIITVSVNDGASDNDYDAVADSTVNVAVTDNDTAGFNIVESGGTTAVTEGGATDSFTVVLTAQPTTNVVFDISSNDTSAATVDQATLTFTNGNWSTPQTITISAPQDSDIVSETPVITVAVNDPSSDNNWDPVANQTVNVAVTDNDAAGFSITQSAGTTAVTEGGATDSFDVVLTAQPSTNVVFSVSSDDTSAATVDFSTLTFTNANWNTPQIVTVTGPEDGDTVGETPVITVSVTDASSDDAWDPLGDQTVNVTVTDNDTPGYSVVQSGGTTNVTEGGATDSFTVVLTAQPSTDVVFDISSDDTSAATVDLSTLTFTTGNWSTPQTITVSAPQDPDVVSEVPTITIAVNDAGSDNAWDPLANETVTVNVTDDDTANIVVVESGGGTAVTEGGATDSFTVALTAQPATDVVLTVVSDDTTAATVALATLTFTNGNWSTPQTVTVTAPQDADIVSESPIVTIAVDDAASDNNWDPVANQTVTVAVTDDDTAGFSITESSGMTSVTEGGATDNFDVVLTAQPSSDVVFDISSNDTTSATVAPATLTFTTGNWNTPQAITVTAPQDSDSDSETPVVTVAVNDPGSDNAWDPLASQMVNVSVTDDDTPGISITETAGTTVITEGGATDAIDVVLTAQPATDVVITVISDDPQQATVAPATLTFTNVNWNTPQTITVTGPEEDGDFANGTVTLTFAIDDGASDDAFDGVADETVSVSITDNDVAPAPTPPAAPSSGFSGGGGGFSAPTTPPALTPSEEEVALRSSAPEEPEEEAQEECTGSGCGLKEITGSGSTMGGGGGYSGCGGGGGSGGSGGASVPQELLQYVALINERCAASDAAQEAAATLSAENPLGSITRTELVKTLVLCKSITLSDSYTQPFSDVPLNYPDASYIYEALKLGIVDGYPDGTFRPNNDITREEATKIIVLAQFDGAAAQFAEIPTPFTDVVSGEWYARFVSFAFTRGMISGYLYPNGSPQNIFGVGNSITRAEAAKIIVNAFGL